jgi:hypothetical protein
MITYYNHTVFRKDFLSIQDVYNDMDMVNEASLNAVDRARIMFNNDLYNE